MYRKLMNLINRKPMAVRVTKNPPLLKHLIEVEISYRQSNSPVRIPK